MLPDASLYSSILQLVDRKDVELIDRHSDVRHGKHDNVSHQAKSSPQPPQKVKATIFPSLKVSLDKLYEPLWMKGTYVALLGAMTFVVICSSSVFSTATAVTATEFGVSQDLIRLDIRSLRAKFCYWFRRLYSMPVKFLSLPITLSSYFKFRGFG